MDIEEGQWFKANNKDEYDRVKSHGHARVQLGTWDGPGKYMICRYSQPCPRGCCDDTVNEIISAEDVKVIVREKMKNLAVILREANDAV